MSQVWIEVLTESFQDLWIGFIGFVPNLLVAIIIFIAGWIVGAILGRVVSQVIKSIKVDSVLEGVGVSDVLSKSGFRLDSGAFVGGLVRWFFIIAFLVASFEVLGLSQVTLFLQQVVLSYLPNVIVAALILLVAAVIADAMQKVVVGSAKAADVAHAHFLGGITRWSIWIFAIIIALSHLGIAPQFMYTLFTGFVAMLAIAGGLSFGLGGRDAAERYIEKLRGEISK